MICFFQKQLRIVTSASPALLLGAVLALNSIGPSRVSADDYQGATHMMPFEEDTIHYNKTLAGGPIADRRAHV